MFLRSTNRRKDGKNHRYFSIVENRRLPGGKTAQRTVLYLGEINDQQQAAWRKTLDVFDETEQRFTSLSLFPDDRELPADAVDSMQVRLSGLELKRPRIFGNCWLACELWQQLGLDEFWQERLPEGRESHASHTLDRGAPIHLVQATTRSCFHQHETRLPACTAARLYADGRTPSDRGWFRRTRWRNGLRRLVILHGGTVRVEQRFECDGCYRPEPSKPASGGRPRTGVGSIGRKRKAVSY